MNDRQLIEDLLSALEYHTEQTRPIQFSSVAIEVAREHLRKPAQPAREWVGLTKEDKAEIVAATERDDRGYVMALVEAKLMEKNT